MHKLKRKMLLVERRKFVIMLFVYIAQQTIRPWKSIIVLILTSIVKILLLKTVIMLLKHVDILQTGL